MASSTPETPDAPGTPTTPDTSAQRRRKSGAAIAAIAAIVAIVAVAVTAALRPSASGLEENIHSPATSFLVRDGKFDCTTLYENVPIGVLQQVPGLVTSRLDPNTTNASTLPGGGTSCSVSFTATGDNATLETAENADAVTLRNTLNLLGLPLDYRSFVISTSRTCRSLPLSAPEVLTDSAGLRWELGQTRIDDDALAAELIRLDDDQLGCLTAFVSFPEGFVTEVQSATTRRFLKKFATAAAKPLSAAVAAARSGQAGQSTNPEPTFSHKGVFDCRAYLFSSSLTQQRQVGLIADFSRVPGDFVFTDSARAGEEQTPLYRIADDGSAVTCWFKAPAGADIALPTDSFGAIAVSATSTSPLDDIALPHSVPVSMLDATVGKEASALGKWMYFLYVPGASGALSPSVSPLELEQSRVASLNLYRCQNPDKPSSGQNCLILSTPLASSSDNPIVSGTISPGSGSTLAPENFKALASIALRVEPLLSPSG